MPDVLSDDELNVLAAEYVLGTLDHDERNGAKALLEVDPTFRQVVEVWERRFGDLHLMVESVPPDRALWERIRPKVAGLEQVPVAIPSEPRPRPPADGAPQVLAPEPSAPETPARETSASTDEPASEPEVTLDELEASAPVTDEASAAAETPPVRQEPPPVREPPVMPIRPPAVQGFVPPPPMLRRPPAAPVAVAPRPGYGGWRAAGLLMSLIAILLTGLIGVWRFFPERLPEKLRADVVLKLTPPAPPVAPEPPPTPRPRPPAPFNE